MITLDLQNRLPIYEQLREQVVHLIVAGVLKGDDQLPSVRSFARDLGINPNTVQKAYQTLELEGLIYSLSGKGNFINPDPDIVGKIIDDYKLDFKQSVLEAKKMRLTKSDLMAVIEQVYKGGN